MAKKEIMVRYLSLCCAMLVSVLVSAQETDVWNTTYKQIEQSIRKPMFANQSYNIKDFGARTDATAAENQKAINEAIVSCSNEGGGRLIVPEGVWNTGGIVLQTGVNLVLEKGATLLFSADTNLYPLVRTRWEGNDCWNYQPMIYAADATDIAITGEGTIDGGAGMDAWWPMCGAAHYNWTDKTPEHQRVTRGELMQMNEKRVPIDERRFGKGKGLRPQLVNFFQCDGVLIEGVKLLRSPFWVIHPLLCQNVVVRNVYIQNDGPNGDGCDPESCERVLIENCKFDTGDDCIAIKSGRNADGRAFNIPSKDIIVRNCEMLDGHGGVVVGSEISGGCQNVFVENCTMDSPNLERVIRIKTNPCRGGITDGIYVRNVKVGQCREAVLKINLDYEPREKAGRTHNPTVRNVFLDNVTCKKSKYGVLIIGLPTESNVYNIHVKNSDFEGVTTEPVKITGLVHDVKFDNLVINGEKIKNP